MRLQRPAAAQLEVNLIGQLAVTRAILPLLRRGGAARLVNVTSGLGSVAIPYLAPTPPRSSPRRE